MNLFKKMSLISVQGLFQRSVGLMIWVLLATMITGCVGKDKFYFGNEQPFKTRLAIDGIETKNPSIKDLYPEGETPIVKIIKGDIVDEADAQKMITTEETDGFEGMSEKIKSLILKDVPVKQIAELLTELCGYNVVPTKQVENQKINIFMQDIDLRSALETICRLNNLWYREGNNIITLMTREEYVKDIEIRQSEHTRAFYIKYTNAADMAKIIQSLMGQEVYLSAIEDEKIYGHVDPEEDVSLTGKYEGPELDNESSQRIILMNDIVSRTMKSAPVGKKREGEPEEKKITKPQEHPQTGSKPLLAVLTVFKRNNCIIVRSLDAGLLNEMAKIIETLDTPTSQVLLEIKILQITLGNDFESFFKLDYGDFGQTVETRNNPSKNTLKGSGLNLLESASMSASTLGAVFSSNNIQARLALFESEGRANTISSPFLMCANNSRVDFFVGEEVPLRDDVKKETITIGDSGQTINTFIVDIKREELGTSIDLSTFINEDNTVTLEIESEISSAILNYSTIGLADDLGNIIEFPLDGINKSEIKSILTTKSGQTIALGGIIRETIDNKETQVPILGDIPGLGFFFKQKKNTKKKTETIIILTPHIITHPGFSGAKTADFLNRKTSNTIIKEQKESLLTN